MTHVAIMQPYLFPYIGYYQLAFHVEKFVFLDNVNYIKKGYINRNNILLDGQAHRFTLPVKDVSQNRHITDHWFLEGEQKVLDVIARAYSNAPQYDEVLPMVKDVLQFPDKRVSALTAKSIIAVMNYLQIEKEFAYSSQIEIDHQLKGQDKIIALCAALGARRYTNAIGGQELYDRVTFSERGIDLEFISMNSIEYPQSSNIFVPNLSILDALMWNTKGEVRELLHRYTLVIPNATDGARVDD